MARKIDTYEVDDEKRVVWNIDKFLKIQNVIIISDHFCYDGRYLSLCIYPKGDTWFEALTPPVLSMRLRVGRSNVKIDPACNIEYVMGIIKADSSEFRNEKQILRLDTSAKSTPAHELISRHNLELSKNYMLPDGTLTVFCNIRYAQKKPALKAASSTSSSSTYDEVFTLTDKFRDLYLNQRYTDVKIKVQDKEFLAHKIILCAQSEVFAAMFEHDTVEKRNGVVTVKDSDPDSFACFLLYMYTGELDLDNASSVEVISLYKTADKYGLKKLKKECIPYMIKEEMSVDSFCEIFHLAIMQNESDLLSYATNFFIRNANVILTSEEWLKLLEANASLCIKILVKIAKSGIEK